MAFCSLKMPNVRDGRFDALGDLLLSEVKLSAAVPDDLTKVPRKGPFVQASDSITRLSRAASTTALVTSSKVLIPHRRRSYQ